MALYVNLDKNKSLCSEKCGEKLQEIKICVGVGKYLARGGWILVQYDSQSFPRTIDRKVPYL